MALNDFADVQAFFNDFIAANGCNIAGAQHGAFWQQVPGDVNASRDKFINGNVPHVSLPGIGSVKILIKGNSADSMIIKALRGDPPFDRGLRMPKSCAFYSPAQIQELADWIDSLDVPLRKDVSAVTTADRHAIRALLEGAIAPFQAKYGEFARLSDKNVVQFLGRK